MSNKLEDVLVVTKRGKFIRFPYYIIPQDALIKAVELEEGDEVVSMVVVEAMEDLPIKNLR